VEECLKQALSHGLIESRACRLEVAGLIEESKADINVDPLLQRACLLDITKYCDEVPQGAGRRTVFSFYNYVLATLYVNYFIFT